MMKHLAIVFAAAALAIACERPHEMAGTNEQGQTFDEAADELAADVSAAAEDADRKPPQSEAVE
jgi:hypothetical protein